MCGLKVTVPLECVWQSTVKLQKLLQLGSCYGMGKQVQFGSFLTYNSIIKPKDMAAV